MPHLAAQLLQQEALLVGAHLARSQHLPQHLRQHLAGLGCRLVKPCASPHPRLHKLLSVNQQDSASRHMRKQCPMVLRAARGLRMLLHTRNSNHK